MILPQLASPSRKSTAMSEHRRLYAKIRSLVEQRNFDAIDIAQVNSQKQNIIRYLSVPDDDDMHDDFEELTFYQERYLSLSRFLALRRDKGGRADQRDLEGIVELWGRQYQTEKEEESSDNKKIFKQAYSFEYEQKNETKGSKKPTNVEQKMGSTANGGIGQTIFDFFEKKQKQVRVRGFKDLIETNSNLASRSQPFKKKTRKPGHDIEIKKLLEENKRLHVQLQNKSKEDDELNQFQKNVLRQEKEHCMKRIQQLEQQIEELARNNYKFQEIERTRKGMTSFGNQSERSSRTEYMPYYLPTRPNDLNVITEKNKVPKVQHCSSKDNILLELAAEIPPIEKKQQHSFDDVRYEIEPHNTRARDDNKILQSLLDEEDDRGYQVKVRQAPPKLLSAGQQSYHSSKYRQNRDNKVSHNNSVSNVSRFDSFSIAPTAYNNSSMFLNASKNLISIDSVTSTRNKVAFFKNSLVIVKDQSYEIAFKRSSMDPTMTRMRIILYINNKTGGSPRVSIDYDYELGYYNLKITQKLTQLNPYEQSREVIEMQLSLNCPDLNSAVDVHVSIGDKKYDLWLPVCFIEWTQETLSSQQPAGYMVVQPDRQFTSYEQALKILPLGRKVAPSVDQVQTYLYGRSRFGSHEVKLTWWQKELTIDAGSSCIDFLGFVMHHFK